MGEDSLEKTLRERLKTREKEAQMVRWLDGVNGHGFEQAPGDSGGQRSLVCCSPRGCKELDVT